MKEHVYCIMLKSLFTSSNGKEEINFLDFVKIVQAPIITPEIIFEIINFV